MELLNAIDDCEVAEDGGDQRKAVYRKAIETVVILSSPFAPHICEELWCELGGQPSILTQDWPAVDPDALLRAEVEIVLQVNGKVRGRVTVAADKDPSELEVEVLSLPEVQKYTEGKVVRKVIVIPNKLANVVVG
jgi:leucyl-tRNA synthetase